MTAPLPPWLQRQVVQLSRQPGHALLLTGPSGLGQYALGLALARLWLCENPTPEGACGHCTSCHAIDVRTHPDLFVLMPETLAMELNWPLDERTQEKIDRKELKASKWIKVEATRAAVAFTQMTRSRGNTQVILIHPAERLNVESANTLLKTLEEPVGAVRFILCTEAAHSLLPTIRSRCLAHPMQWPDQAEAVAWLQQALGEQGGAAELWLQAAGGRPDEALVWAQSGLSAQGWGTLPRAVASANGAPFANWPPARLMDVLQKICHDLMVVQTGARPRFFRPADLPPPPSHTALNNWQRDLRTASRTMEHPFSPALLQEAWLTRAQQALEPGAGATLHA